MYPSGGAPDASIVEHIQPGVKFRYSLYKSMPGPLCWTSGFAKRQSLERDGDCAVAAHELHVAFLAGAEVVEDAVLVPVVVIAVLVAGGAGEHND